MVCKHGQEAMWSWMLLDWEEVQWDAATWVSGSPFGCNISEMTTWKFSKFCHALMPITRFFCFFQVSIQDPSPMANGPYAAFLCLMQDHSPGYGCSPLFSLVAYILLHIKNMLTSKREDFHLTWSSYIIQMDLNYICLNSSFLRTCRL